ncbi:NAD(P)-binding protein [Auriculariales sp. MPI-PUGE-AT-0066]|nr:NAD(P)-binding protein [Auriculariales sp. MPI-PUGE-AT-0066]
MSTSAYILQWGILATGGVARDFVGDLLSDPAERGVSDVQHHVVAVGSSNSVEKAREFIHSVCGNDLDASTRAKPYGSYDEVLSGPSVSIVYIGTPQSHHYRNILNALNSGKHVCCEKPFTINSRQAEHIVEVANEKRLFVMEAVWTRFFPITKEILNLLHMQRAIGNIKRVWADFSLKCNPYGAGRLFQPELGGGALLDLGIYPITWAFLALYQPNGRVPPTVKANLLMATDYGVDESTTVSMSFEHVHAVATAETSLAARTARPYCVIIQGDKGELCVEGSCPRPRAYILQRDGQDPIRKDFTFTGHGMHWEADACARAIRDGHIEVPECSHQETLDVMRVLDEVRNGNGFTFPAPLEDILSS